MLNQIRCESDQNGMQVANPIEESLRYVDRRMLNILTWMLMCNVPIRLETTEDLAQRLGWNLVIYSNERRPTGENPEPLQAATQKSPSTQGSASSTMGNVRSVSRLLRRCVPFKDASVLCARLILRSTAISWEINVSDSTRGSAWNTVVLTSLLTLGLMTDRPIQVNP